jgi:hypothetical protein
MDFRWDSQHQLSRIRPLRLSTNFFTRDKIVIYCLFKGPAQLFDGVGVKADYVFNTRYVADKAIIIIAIFDFGGVSFVSHCAHDFTPAFSKNVRASRTC